jgi:hypothetical protein
VLRADAGFREQFESMQRSVAVTSRQLVEHLLDKAGLEPKLTV